MALICTVLPLPLIDISPFFSDDIDSRLAVAAEWDAAMCEYGMATIVGHGLPQVLLCQCLVLVMYASTRHLNTIISPSLPAQGLIDELYDSATSFFSECPPELVSTCGARLTRS